MTTLPSPDLRAAERERVANSASTSSSSYDSTSNSNFTSSSPLNSSLFSIFSTSRRKDDLSKSLSSDASSSLRSSQSAHPHPDGHEELDSDARSIPSVRTTSTTIESYSDIEAESDPTIVEVEEDHTTDAAHLACYFIAGGAAGATSRTVVSPLERLKIIMQVQPHSSNSNSKGKGGGGAYSGVISGLTKMWKEEGIKGFMRGNGINCLRIFPYSAVQFTCYESAKSWLRDPEGELTVLRRLAAGGIAGIASVVSTYPLDLVRSRISIASASLYEEVKQSSTSTSTSASPISQPTPLTSSQLRAAIELRQKQVPGIWQMSVKVYKEEGGLRGLYRGCVPTSAGVMPYVSLNFIGYEYLRKKYATMTGEFELDSHGHQIDQISAMGKLACGAMAGSFSQTLTYPLDVLRRRMQVAGMKDSGLGYNDKNSFDCIRTILRSEGFVGLYRGLLPNLLKVAPSIGTSFATYELVRDGLEKYFASLNQTSLDARNHN